VLRVECKLCWLCRTLVQIVRMIWPAHDFMWIVEEGERYLPEELNFVHEAANMARCRAHLDSPRCA
jgi:predicted unusual protein kinase regulating ubiquinone biosynthesis (AarF/ABC1/UbiB family)